MKEPLIKSRLNTEALWVLNNKKHDLKEIKLIVLGDSHINTYGWNESKNEYELDDNGKRYLKILDHILQNHSDALFIIHGGDTIGDGITDKNNEEKELNMKAFIHSTKSRLFPKNMPVFTTIGNHDFIKERNAFTPRLYNKYIGNIMNDIYIPGTKIHFINLPTLYWRKMGPPYFDDDNLDIMHKTISQNRSIYYILDFHAPLKVGKLKTLYKENLEKAEQYILSGEETTKFLSQINENVIGIFNHHLHEGYSTHKIDYHYRNNHTLKIHKIPYLLTGDGGNPKSLVHPNYYIITINNTNENNPVITKIKPVKVNNL